MVVFHRDNLVPLESGVLRAHRDREERLVIREELEQLASRFVYLHITHMIHINEPCDDSRLDSLFSLSQQLTDSHIAQLSYLMN